MIVIIGAGLAGLSCAHRLHSHGIPFRILEASDEVGGRVRTDSVDGVRLDRGFQILLTAYPWAKKLLDLPSLELRTFESGALVWNGESLRRLNDPIRQPGKIPQTLASGLYELSDLGGLVHLGIQAVRTPPEALLREPDHNALTRSTEGDLKAHGLGEKITESFFRPFFGGVFLERELGTSAALFRFLLKMFATGAAAVPRLGMSEIPRQLASRLPEGSVVLRSPVARVQGDRVILESGESVAAQAIVIATDGETADRLLGREGVKRKWCSTETFWFSAAQSPVRENILVLDGVGEGPVNHLAVMTDVSRDYSPGGQALISANVVEPWPLTGAEREAAVREQLSRWFGPAVTSWKLLRRDSIPYALPALGPDRAFVPDGIEELQDGAIICGDHLSLPSQEGAAASGLHAADVLVRRLGKSG